VNKPFNNWIQEQMKDEAFKMEWDNLSEMVERLRENLEQTDRLLRKTAKHKVESGKEIRERIQLHRENKELLEEKR